MSDRRPLLDLPVPPPIPGRIAVVGVCASGKSTLVEALCALGYDARQCGQEHSHVPDMWQRLSRPQVLVYLCASDGVVLSRRPMTTGVDLLSGQRHRLRHARAHSHIRFNTDTMSRGEVRDRVLGALSELGLRATQRKP